MAERFGVHLLLAALLLALPACSQPPNESAVKLAAGVWAYRNSAGEVLPSGSFTGTPPDSTLTPNALAARQAFDFRSDDPVLGCGEPGMPRALTAGSPMTFAWSDGDLTIRYESMDVRRTVDMNGGAASSGARTPNGRAEGRWEGNVLVVTTTGLDGRVVDLLGTPKSDAMSLEERYSVEEADGETLLRLDLTMTDPQTFVAPYAWHLDFVLRPDWEIMDYECVERPVELTPGVVKD